MSNRPNILLFICDDLDRHDFGYAAEPGTRFTPNIDRIAAEGTQFTRAYCSSPICTPSRWEYLTGRCATRCRGPEYLADNPLDEPARVNWNTDIEPSTPTMASALVQAGYRAGYFGKWHAGPDRVPGMEDLPDGSPDDPEVDRALRAYQERACDLIRVNAGFTDAAAIAWGNKERFPVTALRHHNLAWMTESAFQFLDGCARDQTPFLMHVATTMPHGSVGREGIEHDARYTQGGRLDAEPAHAARRFTLTERLKKAGVEVNDRAMTMLHIDDQLGLLLEALQVRGVLDETIVVVTADHSREPGKGTVYERGSRIPMAVRWPGVAAPGSVCDAMVMNIDWAPTFAAAAGAQAVAALNPSSVDGRDLRPLLTAGVERVRDAVFLSCGYQRGLRLGRWKYIATRLPQRLIADMETGRLDQAPNHMNRPRQGQPAVAATCYPGYFDPDQLYDLSSDPDEQRNLAAEPAFAETVTEMRARLAEHLERADTHPFELQTPPFLTTPRYRELAAASRSHSAASLATLHRSWRSDRWSPRPPRELPCS